MVSINDFEWWRSRHTVSGISSLGGMLDLTAAINPKGENNIYPSANTAETVAGSTKYRIIYLRYNGSESPLKNCSFAEFFGTQADTTSVQWAFDPQPQAYKYSPWKDFNGTSDFTEQAHDAKFNLNRFTICCWLLTGTNFVEDKIVMGKGLYGTDAAGTNWNFTIQMNASEQIYGGFEEASGTDHFAVSPLTGYNDDEWHFVMITYDGANVKLYIDGDTTPKATHATSTVPSTNSHPVRIGTDGDGGGNWFAGAIDEVRIWNVALSASEMLDMYNGIIPQVSKLVYEEKYGADDGSRVAQKLTDQFTAPAGSPVWNSPTDDVPFPPNIGELTTAERIPIIFRYILDPTDATTSIESDTSSFRVYYGLQSGQTPNPDDDGGGQPPAANSDYKIIYNADVDVTSKARDMIALAVEINPNLVLFGGDLNYGSNMTKFFDVVKPIDDNQGSQIRLEVEIGNHDGGNIEDISGHFKYARLGGAVVYGFRVENIAVLGLDSEDSPTGSGQVNFAKAFLEDARNRANIDWIIVFFHRPIYTAESDHDPDESNMRTTYSQMFEDNKVDLVCTGHIHNIQRTFPLKNNGDNDPRIMTTSQGPYDNKNAYKGPIYIINGTGGHDSGGKLYSLKDTPAFNAFQSNSFNAHLVLKFSNNGKTLLCQFVDESVNSRHSWTMTR